LYKRTNKYQELYKLKAKQDISTRDLIINAAIKLFGEKGFEATSTREIANTAGVNLGSVTYYFESKDRLYSEVISELVGTVSPLISMLDSMLTQGKELAGDDPVRRSFLIKRIVEQAIDTFLVTARIELLVPLILRELLYPTSHFIELYEAGPARLHKSMTELLSWIEGTDPTDRKSIIRAHALVGQIIIYRIGSPILQRRLSIEHYTPALIEEIKQELTDFVLTSLKLPNGELQ
jgi:AcrR family transcriptional regulator